MSGIFVHTLSIQNYKCFENQRIDFSPPDGKTPGSGLNILIGENATGKTSILEAFNMLAQSGFSLDNRANVNDFFNFKDPIEITAETTKFKCKMPYPGNYYISRGLKAMIKLRDRKSPGKMLSSAFTTSASFIPTTEHYYNSKDEPSKSLTPYFTMYQDEMIEGDGLNIFYYDKNRTRQLSTGTYKTTFERICDDLNWRFTKELTPEIMERIFQNIAGEYFETVSEAAQKGAGSRLAKEFAEFFDDELYRNLKIDLLNLLHPYDNAFFVVRKDDDLKQVRTKSLGSGIEMALTLLLLQGISGQSKGSIIYLIDEPELHLHPKAQEKVMRLLIDESESKQIILSTHSPYILRNCIKSAGSLIVLNKIGGKIELNYAKKDAWGLFPWSPSTGEVNYSAFGMPTIEFHNELYGYLQNVIGTVAIDEFDKILCEFYEVPQDQVWVRQRGDGRNAELAVTLPTYVRHTIHHPENRLNTPYTEDELRRSIEKMIWVVKNSP